MPFGIRVFWPPMCRPDLMRARALYFHCEKRSVRACHRFRPTTVGHAATTVALAVCATIVVLVLGIATALPLRRYQAFSCARA